MYAAPFTKENVPSSCVYSTQGNIVCQKIANSDPVIPMAPYSCGKPVVEKYMDLSLDSMKNKAMNVFGMSTQEKHENYMDLNLDSMKNKAMNVFGMSSEKYSNYDEELLKQVTKMMPKPPPNQVPPETEKFVDFNMNSMMQKFAPPKKEMITDQAKTAEMFHNSYSPVETAMNVSYSVSPWPF